MVAFAKQTNRFDQYKQQNAMTASPGDLTLMLYNGCITNLKLFKTFVIEKNIEKAHEYSQKAQAIIDELLRTLDMRYPISEQLMKLYDFIQNLIIEANLQKDIEKSETAIEFLTELRDTWQEAVRINRRNMMCAGDAI